MIVRKSQAEIDRMRTAGIVVAAAIREVAGKVRPGVKTSELDAVVERVITSAGCIPSFKGYRGFPASICSSINEEVVHGIPGPRRLREGDIVKLDVGAIYEGYHADSAHTVYVGSNPPDAVRRLLETTEASLWAGIAASRAGARLGDVGYAVQQVAETAGFSVVREYVGHGIGRELHEEPQIPNYGPAGRGARLEPGMTLAIEPMVNAGDWRTEVLKDGWTVVTADRSLSAHFEHTVAVTKGDPLVLTLAETPAQVATAGGSGGSV